jgi:hypothetical protein
MLDKFFNWGKKKELPPGPDISFGRYSDNNKPLAKVNRWTEADNLFKDKKYQESIDAFFEYLRDDDVHNVKYERNGVNGSFECFQGSKIVRGSFNENGVSAEVTLARMPQPSVPVMRRLLEMNFTLYYSRFALENDRLCMRFNTAIHAANPSKLYYGLKELATKADKQDDLLVQDFKLLETSDSEHVVTITDAEKEIKYDFIQQWIKKTLDTIAAVDMEKFSGGIAYMLLALTYRIDYLVVPEGQLLNDLEKIAGIYFKKDERPVTEKSRDMMEEFRKIQAKTREEIFPNLFRSKYTFAIVAPQQYKTIADSIHNTNLNVNWYRDNNHGYIATQVSEYGISYCQYSYSLPKVITEFFHLYMMINYGDFFKALGYHTSYYDVEKNLFSVQAITDRIKDIQDRWRAKYPNIEFRVNNLKYDTLANFDYSFTTELESLNMETK